MDWWYFPQFLVENVCIQKKEAVSKVTDTASFGMMVL